MTQMSTDRQFQLQLLGGFGLRASSCSAIAISSRKARALLAYVAMQEPMQVSRERLATLLWPDRIDRQARQNLRKCLASLRADLAGVADRVLLIDAETVGISDVVAVDARCLRKLSHADAAADLEDAAALCRGQFLADLTMDGEEFRDWALSERAQLDAAAAMVLAKLASRADQVGDAHHAVELATRLTAIDPLCEDWARLSLRIAARHIGRDKALMQARSFVALLHKELDVAPEADTADLIEQIKAGRIAPVRPPAAPIGEAIEHAAPLDPGEDRAVAPSTATAHRASQPAIASAVVAVLAVLIAYVSVANGPQIGSLKPAVVDGRMIDRSTIPLLVAPLQSATPETAALARELTENLVTSVSQFSGLTVIDGRSIANPPDVSDSAAAAAGIALATRGSLRRQGSNIELDVGLDDTADHAVVWAGNFTGSGDGLSDLVLPRRIARDLQVQANFATARGVDGKDVNRATLEQLIAKALIVHYRGSTADDGASATELYQEALQRDRNSAVALIGLAGELVTSSVNLQSEQRPALAQAEQLLKRALQINPRIERAHYWLGIIDLLRGQHDLALQAFERALQLNPGFLPAEAHAGHALVLLGRTDEGLKRIQNALAESLDDPNQTAWLRFAGVAELELGNDKQAIESLLQAAALAVPTAPLRAALASAYTLTGQPAKSRQQLRLMKTAADPAALEQFLNGVARIDSRQSSRYLQGLQLATRDIL
jgi:DNA-binding SARP family transcriptional activator/tetratricopeptide (TPR) repeat protein